jgi:ferrous iron transport protein B
MSCSAKLPIYGLICSAFFGAYAGLVVFGLYLLGMLTGIVSGLIFKRTIFSGDAPAFVLELPPYRMPSIKNTLQHVWERVRDFITRAGTLIFLMSVLLWLLQNFDLGFNLTDDPATSILGVIGTFIAPIFRPMGFGMWQSSVALLTGLVAKEAVVASLSMFYGFSLTAGNSVVAGALATTFTPLSAFSFLVFVLLYVPCVAAVATIRKEMASLKWTLASVGWQLLTAYVLSTLVYQLGRLIGLV